MSFLPADILPGSASVLGMLTEAGPTQPFYAPASGGGGGGSSSFSTLSVSSLTVSSINGVAPGGGSSLFQSTFNGVTIDPTASTILMEMPAGQFGYNGLVQGGGGTSLLTGYISVAVDLSGPNYFGSISDQTQAQPANSFNATMVINEGDSGLSTIKLIVANNGIATGQFTGVVNKLY